MFIIGNTPLSFLKTLFFIPEFSHNHKVAKAYKIMIICIKFNWFKHLPSFSSVRYEIENCEFCYHSNRDDRDPKIPPTKIPPTKIPPSENSILAKILVRLG